MVVGDARSTPDGGVQEVERMASEGVAAIVGGFASPICLAATQAASRYDIPYLVDVGVSDQIVSRGLDNTFRFAPGFGMVSKQAIANLVKLNDGAGKPAKTVVLVHEDGLFGIGSRQADADRAAQANGFEILDTIAHPTPARDMSNIALQIRAKNPDLVIPSSYYGEFVLLARTMQQQRVRPKGDLLRAERRGVQLSLCQGIPGGRAIRDGLQSLVRSTQGGGADAQAGGGGATANSSPTMSRSTIRTICCSPTRSSAPPQRTARRSPRRSRLRPSRATSCPMARRKFVNGQNTGAAPVNTQVQDKDIKVIFPSDFADAKPVFPVPA